jgi:hypothetical protein
VSSIPPAWRGARHIRLAAFKALVDNFAGMWLAGGDMYDDPTKPSVLPATPTVFDGPGALDVFPLDGALYIYPPAAQQLAQARPPWICIEDVASGGRTGNDDFLGVMEGLVIVVRARIGADHTDTKTAKALTRMRAESMCQGALWAISKGIGPAARVLDPAKAYGIVAGGFIDRIVVTEGPPEGQVDGQQDSVFDAVGSLRFDQRLREYRAGA